MALELILDIVDDAEIDQGLIGGRRLVRTGIVKGMTTGTVTSSKLALIKMLENAPGMPLLGDAIDPTYPTYLCMHRIARGIPNTLGTMARVWLHYETPGGGGTPLERFAAEDDISIQAEPTNVFPGTAKQLLCSLTSSSPDYTAAALASTERPITANFPRTIRSLVLYGLFSDRPSAAVANAGNTVNHAYWQGLGVGRWKCVGVKAKYSSRDGMYSVVAGFLTKGAGLGDDWSTYEIPRDPSTGQFAKVTDSILAAEYAKPYVYGIMSDKNSIWHAGGAGVSNFSSTFGDTFPIGD